MGGSSQAASMDNATTGQGNLGQGFGTNQGNLGQGFDNTSGERRGDTKYVPLVAYRDAYVTLAQAWCVSADFDTNAAGAGSGVGGAGTGGSQYGAGTGGATGKARFALRYRGIDVSQTWS